jgi:hypothetical protein
MRFKLTAQHYINDRLLEEGYVIGEGTDVPFLDKNGNYLPPSDYMEGLDDESRTAVDKVLAMANKLFSDLSMTMEPAGADLTARELDPVDPTKPKGK